jgi:hypothetical protein
MDAALCYRRLLHCVTMFHFGKPKTAGEWVVHFVGAIIALFLIWWMFRLYIV